MIIHIVNVNYIGYHFYLHCILLQVIKGLEQLVKLTRLYLYSNKIAAVSGVNHLLKLQKLWLNGNRISKIEVWFVYQHSTCTVHMYTCLSACRGCELFIINN